MRDLLADAISTLPALLKSRLEASILFYMANLTSMRNHIVPAMVEAYDVWLESRDTSRLDALVDESERHWKTIATGMLALFDQYGENSHEHIESLVNNNVL